MSKDKEMEASKKLDRVLKDALELSDIEAPKGGKLLPEQASNFYRKMIEVANLIGAIRTQEINRPATSIPRIGMAPWVLYNKTECQGAQAGEDTKSDFDEVPIELKRLRVTQRVSTEVLEDNIERESLMGTIESLLFERIASNVSDVVLNSDTTFTDANAAKQAVLSARDGLIKQAQAGAGAVDPVAPIAPATTVPVDKDTLSGMFKAMPNAYKGNKSSLRYVMSLNQEECLRNKIADRETGLGDAVLEGDMVRVNGIEVVADAHVPDTVILLSNPMNMVFVPHVGNLKVVKHYDEETDCHNIHYHLNFGFAWEDLEGVVYQTVALA